MKKTEIFPGIVEEVDGWNTKRWINRDKVKSSSEYKNLLSSLNMAKDLLDKAYEIVENVKENTLCSDGKTEIGTVEDLLLESKTPEEVLDTLLGIK